MKKRIILLFVVLILLNFLKIDLIQGNHQSKKNTVYMSVNYAMGTYFDQSIVKGSVQGTSIRIKVDVTNCDVDYVSLALTPTLIDSNGTRYTQSTTNFSLSKGGSFTITRNFGTSNTTLADIWTCEMKLSYSGGSTITAQNIQYGVVLNINNQDTATVGDTMYDPDGDLSQHTAYYCGPASAYAIKKYKNKDGGRFQKEIYEWIGLTPPTGPDILQHLTYLNDICSLSYQRYDVPNNFSNSTQMRNIIRASTKIFNPLMGIVAINSTTKTSINGWKNYPNTTSGHYLTILGVDPDKVWYLEPFYGSDYGFNRLEILWSANQDYRPPEYDRSTIREKIDIVQMASSNIFYQILYDRRVSGDGYDGMLGR